MLALDAARKALSAAERAHGTNSHLVVNDLIAFADACATVEDYETAGAAYARAAELQQQTLRDIDGDLLPRLHARVVAFNRMGQTYLKLHRFETAGAAFKRALANAELVFLPVSEEVKIARTGIALARAYSVRSDNAEAFYEQLLDSCKTAFGPDHPEVARVLEAYLWRAKDMENTALAERQARRLVDLLGKIMPAHHPATAHALNRLASILYETGRRDEALPLLQEALDIRVKAFGAGHPKTVRARHQLADLCQEMGLPEKAAEYRANTGHGTK